MADKSSKILFLFFCTVVLTSIFIYFSNANKTQWKNINGFELKITGELNQIEEFYSSIVKRLSAYPDWIDIVVTGEVDNFQKEYAPFRISSKRFIDFNLIFTSKDITDLLTQYSYFLDKVLLNNTSPNLSNIKNELNLLLQFCIMLNAHLLDNDKIIMSDVVDLMKYGINPYYDVIEKTQTIYIILNHEERNDSQLEIISSQIIAELDDLNKTVDVNCFLNKSKFKVDESEMSLLSSNNEIYKSSRFYHIYKFLPTLRETNFNLRMKQLKTNIHVNQFKSGFKANDFLIILSKIEEQLIEFQLRDDFSDSLITQSANLLVGDGERALGLLTTTIDLFDDRRYQYKVENFLVQSGFYLNNEVKRISDVIYPSIHSLPISISSKLIKNSNPLIYNLK